MIKINNKIINLYYFKINKLKIFIIMIKLIKQKNKIKNNNNNLMNNTKKTKLF